jgi:hypothetical protein
MPRITDLLEAAKDKPDDAIGKILMAHPNVALLWSLHGRTTNIEFLTYQLLKERSDETT